MTAFDNFDLFHIIDGYLQKYYVFNVAFTKSNYKLKSTQNLPQELLEKNKTTYVRQRVINLHKPPQFVPDAFNDYVDVKV
jgi:hypothetical protein